jgi:hypothetical protein
VVKPGGDMELRIDCLMAWSTSFRSLPLWRAHSTAFVALRFDKQGVDWHWWGMSGEVPSDERPSPLVMAGDAALTFDWKPVRWRKTRLAMWLVVAAVGHLLVFYLFQVVTESSPRQAPPVREAMILPGTQEMTRRVLEGVEDRLPGLGEGVPLVESEDKALAALVKGYVPTWQDHRPALKPLPGQGGGAWPSSVPGPPVLLPGLPAIDAGSAKGGTAVAGVDPMPAGAASIRPLPVLQFQSGLLDRKMEAGPVWPAAVTAEEWPEEGPASFMLGVSPEGEVVSCLSLGTSAGLDEEVLREVLMKLKFSPAAKGKEEPQWGWVEVLW